MIKRILSFGILSLCLGMVSCSEERELNELELNSEYVLPQGENTVADTRIVELFNNTGSIFLYKFVDRDFYFDFTSSYHYDLPDPQYVDEFLDFLDDIYLQFYSDKFKHKFLPYRVLLTEKMYTTTSGENTYYDYMLSTNTLVLSWCSDTVLPATAKLTYKNKLNYSLWYYWIYTAQSLTIPDEFLAVSDYTCSNKPNTTVTSDNYVRNRGFIKNDYANKEINASTVYWSSSSMTKQQMMDFVAYCAGMIYRTDADWEEDLQWPLVKQKYDIVVKYFKEEWGFDISKIGNTPVK